MTKTLVQNRRARREYHIEDTYEAGIELKGPEVKSIRGGSANIAESYITIRDGQAYIRGMHVSPYEQGNIQNVDPTRPRRLLLHKHEINRLDASIQRQGYTVIPTKLYLNNRGLIKLEIATAKGKKLQDRREDIKRRDAQRQMEQAMRDHNY